VRVLVDRPAHLRVVVRMAVELALVLVLVAVDAWRRRVGARLRAGVRVSVCGLAHRTPDRRARADFSTA